MSYSPVKNVVKFKCVDKLGVPYAGVQYPQITTLSRGQFHLQTTFTKGENEVWYCVVYKSSGDSRFQVELEFLIQ